MKRTSLSFLALVLAAVLSLSAVASAGAETVIDTITGVGTTQAFTDEAVPEEDIRSILQAGLAAASAINQQPWYFVAITNHDVMQEIAGSGMSFGPRPEGAGAPPQQDGAPAGGERKAPPMAAASTGKKAGLGDSPLAIVVYMNPSSASPDPDFDCGLATQNMALAAASLGYGVKIVSSPTMSLNGANHDALCEKLGVDPALQAVAVLLIGRADETVDATSGASVRETLEDKTSIIR